MKRIFTIPAILLFICATLSINSCSENVLPGAAFQRPLIQSAYFMGEIMDIEIIAYDNDGSIAQVEILLNGTSIAILNSKPYKFSYEINNIQPGDYDLVAVVTDDKGGQRSGEIAITVLPDLEEFTDPRDGNTYRYVTIGNQAWMADNLAYLPEVYPPSEGSDSLLYYYVYNYYENDISTAKQTEEYSKFGVLYNWEAAQKAAPEGWHLPTESEWLELHGCIEQELGESKVGSYLMHTSEGGTNQYGFSAILAGKRSISWVSEVAIPGYEVLGDPSFKGGCYWWSSSEYAGPWGHGAIIGEIKSNDPYFNMGPLFDRSCAISLRCIKD